jgi:hypothetical protein
VLPPGICVGVGVGVWATEKLADIKKAMAASVSRQRTKRGLGLHVSERIDGDKSNDLRGVGINQGGPECALMMTDGCKGFVTA